MRVKMSVSWNISGLCRCCHAQGNFKSLEAKTTFKGNDIIFTSMLRDTFKIIMRLAENPKFNSICLKCETILLQATQFRDQVIASEKKLNEYILQQIDIEDASIIGNNIKVEVDIDDNTSVLDFVDQNTEDDEPLSKLKDSKLEISDGDVKVVSQKTYKDSTCWDNELNTTNDDIMSPHKLQMKKRTQYTCEHCPKKFKYKGSLDLHMNLHSGRKTFVCKLCDTSYVTNKEVNAHIRRAHKSNEGYRCDVCNEIYKEPRQLKKHWAKHYPEKFGCKICERQFVYKRGLKEHLLSHTGEKRYTCNVCNRSFLHNQILKQHIYTHTGERPHVCDVCGKSFPQRTHLRRHIGVVHDKYKPASCGVCMKQFSSKSYLAVHVRQHTGEKPHTCNICNRNFRALTTLRVHMRTHTGQKPYACTFCPRQFTQMASFKLHQRVHTGEKPFQCKICKKTFADNGYLRQHLRIHTDARPFACDTCKRCFREARQLKIHQRVHSGLKPYTCKVCNKQIGNLSKHMKLHSAGGQYACEICEKRFAVSGNLKVHMRTHSSEAELCQYCNCYVLSGLRRHRCHQSSVGDV